MPVTKSLDSVAPTSQLQIYADQIRLMGNEQLNSVRYISTAGIDPAILRLLSRDQGAPALQHQIITQEHTEGAPVSATLPESMNDNTMFAPVETGSKPYPHGPGHPLRLHPLPLPATGRPLVAYLREQAREMLANASPTSIRPKSASRNEQLAAQGKHHFANLHDPLAGIYAEIWAVIREATARDLSSPQPPTNHLGNFPLNGETRYPDPGVIPVFLLDPVSGHSLTFIDDDGCDPNWVYVEDHITAEIQSRAGQLGKRRCGRCCRWRFWDKFMNLEGVCVFCLKNGEVPGWVLADTER